jgi:hypothetical protein
MSTGLPNSIPLMGNIGMIFVGNEGITTNCDKRGAVHGCLSSKMRMIVDIARGSYNSPQARATV